MFTELKYRFLFIKREKCKKCILLYTEMYENICVSVWFFVYCVYYVGFLRFWLLMCTGKQLVVNGDQSSS